MKARASETACRDVEPLLSPCVDGELLDDDLAAVRAHVADCASCADRLATLQALKRAVARAPREALPAALDARVRADVHAEALRDNRRVAAGVVALAALFVVAAVGAGAAVWLRASPAAAPTVAAAGLGARQPRVVTAVIERHKLDLPVDVASPDVRRVQEYVAGHVARNLRVPRLERLGFGLQGARVIDLDTHRAAQLVYTGGYGQRLSVTALPDPDGAVAASFASPFATVDEGLAVRLLKGDGAVYAVVGDVDESNLEKVSTELER